MQRFAPVRATPDGSPAPATIERARSGGMPDLQAATPPSTAATTREERLGLGTRLAYGLGQTAVGFKTRAFDSFLFFYYSQVVGLSGTLVGLAIFLALCADALADPLVGAVSDNWRSRLGRRHPFLYGGAAPLALAFYLTFAPPMALRDAGLFWWLLTFALLTRMAMTIVYVPLMALGAELTEDAAERMALVAWRYAFGLFGQACLVVAGFTLFFTPSPEFPDGHLDPAAYPRLSAVVATAILAVVWISAAGTHRRIPYLPRQRAKRNPFRLATWWADLRLAIANDSFRAVFFASSCYSVSRGVQLALGMHVLTYFWQLPAADIQFSVVARLLGVALGLPIGRAAARLVEKRVLMGAGIGWFFAVGTLPVALRLLDWFPQNNDPWTLRLVVLCNVIAGLGGGVALVANGSMLADISDQHELERGARQEGVFFGAEGLAEKACSGLGLLLAGLAIDVIRFPADAGTTGVEPDIVARLGIVYGPLLLVAAGASALFLRRYGLDRERHRGILRRLAVARAAADRFHGPAGGT